MDKNSVVSQELNAFGKEMAKEKPSDLVIEKLSIYAVTWNLHGKTARPEDIKMLLPKDKIHHIIIVGTEECMRSILTSLFFSDKSSWETMVQNHLGEEYIRIKAETLSAIHVIVFVHKLLASYVQNVRSASIKNGFYGTLGNKGGVAIALEIFEQSLLILNCHLAAGQTYFSKRNDDFLRINTLIPIENPKKSGNQSVSDGFDHCIWLGDFNYRIDLKLKEVTGLLFPQKNVYENITRLLNHDQMKIEKLKGTLFINNFKEGEITFPPTYKLIVGSHDYVLEDGGDRIPGWTDRILFKSRKLGMLTVKEYSSIMEITYSDHKPVYAVFELDLAENKKGSGEKLDE